MLFQLPIDSNLLDYEVVIDLDGVDYIFRITWRERLQSWYMSIFDVDRNPLLEGKRIATNSILNRAVKDIIQGTMTAITLDANDDDPGVTDLGNRVVIMYREAT